MGSAGPDFRLGRELRSSDRRPDGRRLDARDERRGEDGPARRSLPDRSRCLGFRRSRGDRGEQGFQGGERNPLVRPFEGTLRGRDVRRRVDLARRRRHAGALRGPSRASVAASRSHVFAGALRRSLRGRASRRVRPERPRRRGVGAGSAWRSRKRFSLTRVRRLTGRTAPARASTRTGRSPARPAPRERSRRARRGRVRSDPRAAAPAGSGPPLPGDACRRLLRA